MLFKLSFKNMKKSIKDYGIYFLTLVLGVAIFYMFNSLDSQQAMLQVSQSTRKLIQLMIEMLGMVSVFVAVILGLLIVYANNFLINRRKKEFGIYMTLGMGRRQISKIILLETILIGVISLLIGLVVGIFASQFMSVLVSKLFEADMSEFTFVFSKTACIKTCLYFAIMYVAVMMFNTFTISRYKLINLITSEKKNEKIKIKNPIVSILVFLVAVVMLGYAYWQVTAGVQTLNSADKLLKPILLGIASTILIFWSLSGFLLRVIQSAKKVYLKNTNMFVLRQINNKINTTVISISVICLMLFMTITILSSALSLRNTMQRELIEMTPVDINLYKIANLEESHTVEETLENNGFNNNLLKDIVEIKIYATNELTWEKFFGNQVGEVKQDFPRLAYNTTESIIKISDYNKIARLYGTQEYELTEKEYIVLCDFDSMTELRNRVLKEGRHPITIAGKEYQSKYKECKEGFVNISTSHTNTGIILVPDSCNLKEEETQMHFLAANYNATTDEEKQKIEEIIASKDTEFAKKISEKGIYLNTMTKISIFEASIGLATIITFIAIYLGIIFLIASAAILALKQLTESSDNKQRYTILRKIGCDEKMINQALFRQIGIFFGMPLLLAIIHSIFGIKFVMTMMQGLMGSEELLPSIIVTVIVMGAIYGAYFVATYVGSKTIIKEE